MSILHNTLTTTTYTAKILMTGVAIFLYPDSFEDLNNVISECKLLTLQERSAVKGQSYVHRLRFALWAWTNTHPVTLQVSLNVTALDRLPFVYVSVLVNVQQSHVKQQLHQQTSEWICGRRVHTHTHTQYIIFFTFILQLTRTSGHRWKWLTLKNEDPSQLHLHSCLSEESVSM